MGNRKGIVPEYLRNALPPKTFLGQVPLKMPFFVLERS